MHLIKFHVGWPFDSGEKAKNRFSRHQPWLPIVFPIRTALAIFDLQVTLILPTKIQANLPFGSGEEAKSRFSSWRPRRPSWISDSNKFSNFYLQVSPMLPTKIQVNRSFSSEENKLKMDFKDGGHLGLPIGTIFSYF